MLTYLPDGKVFCVEASVLETHFPIPHIGFDGKDWFVTLKSHRTGNQVKFIRRREIWDDEGDLHWVEFDGLGPDKGCVLRVFND
jgi:hypothetical protein